MMTGEVRQAGGGVAGAASYTRRLLPGLQSGVTAERNAFGNVAMLTLALYNFVR